MLPCSNDMFHVQKAVNPCVLFAGLWGSNDRQLFQRKQLAASRSGICKFLLQYGASGATHRKYYAVTAHTVYAYICYSLIVNC